ncbi:MAG: hypothetical protein HZB39_05550 [Planctomycetes bacterium]|nr:hypothetical protein [Planctomycetota bacterium]
MTTSVRPIAFLAFAFFTPFATAQITPGNLVVVRVGDGAAALSSAATRYALDELTTAGAPVQTIPMPTSASGPNRACNVAGTATSEGFLTQSDDGRYLVSTGYDAALGTASVAGTTSALVNRVVARIAMDETIDTSTALGDAYSAGNIRSATSLDGSQFWTSGSNGSVRYATLGGTTTTQLSTTITNVRVVNVYSGQLYTSSATGAFQGVNSVGSGLPTTSGQTITLLPGFPTASGPSAYDYFFADANTVYVADDRTTTAGGIQKWTLSAGTWTLQYTLNPAASTGCRGLTGTVAGGVATLFATTSTSSNNALVTVTDTGPASTFTTLATAGTNMVFRGVRHVRCVSAATETFGTATPHSGGTPVIGVQSAFTLGASTGITASGMLANDTAVFAAGIRVLPIDMTVYGAQAGSEYHLFTLDYVGIPTDPTGAATWSISVPNLVSLCGGAMSWQVLQVDFAMPFALPIAFSQGLTTRVGI